MRKLSRASPTSSDMEVTVKLPKLEITKFNGTHLDWRGFGINLVWKLTAQDWLL